MENPFAFMAEMGRPLAALVLASVVVMGSPGPSTISATAVGASFGIRRSFHYVCGLVAGAMAVLLAVAAGVVALVMAMPYAGRVLNGIAVVYIFYLAFKIATAPPLEAAQTHAPAPAFMGGFVLAVANPKAYLAIAAVFSGSTLIAENHGADAVVKVAVLSVMIVIIHAGWLFAGASLSRVLCDPKSARVVNVSLAAALVVMTVVSVWG